MRTKKHPNKQVLLIGVIWVEIGRRIWNRGLVPTCDLPIEVVGLSGLNMILLV